MPVYTARCSNCNNEQDYISKIDDRHITPLCAECDSPTEKILTATMVGAMGISDHAAVKSPINGKMLYGRSDYLKHMKEHGVRPQSDMKGEAEHQRKQQASTNKKKRKEAIIDAYNKVKGA